MIYLKIDNTWIIAVIAAFALIVIILLAVYVLPSSNVSANTSATNSSQPLPAEAQFTVIPGNPTVVSNEPVNTTSRPVLISWFGSVTDSFGKPFGGLYVTLHLMTPAGEAFTMTTRSYVDLPYPGSYVFDNIEITPDLTYAYATVSGDVGDGVQYYGRGENYTLNVSRIAAGFIVLHVPMPDQINVTVNNSTLTSTKSTLIMAQLYLNGKPYKRSGTIVTFTGDNDNVAILPEIKTNVTDESGFASLVLTSLGGPGNVNVTGNTKIGISRNLTDTCMIKVVK